MATNLRRTTKVGLFAGYLALFGAVVVARANPSTGYELSPYAATPVAVWAGLAVAFAAGTLVAFAVARERRVHDAAVLLLAATAVAFFAMPILRGYYFYGGGDSLSHVGWAREIASGALDPANLLYPGMHTATVLVGAVADVSLLHANMYVVLVAFPLVFLLCLPLAVQLLAGTPHAYVVGLLAAALFTPINNIAVHPVAHAASQAIFLSAFPFYLALAYLVRRPTPERRRGWRSLLPRPANASGLGALLAVASAALVLVHPQQALNLALAFAAIAAVQVAVRRWAPDLVDASRLFHVQAAVALAAFLAWAPRFERVSGAVTSTLMSIVSRESGGGTVVAQKSTSLTTVGGSLPVIFTKLFLAATVLSALAAGLILLALGRRLDDDRTTTLVTYLAVALVPVVGVFLVVFASSAGDMYFRYHGFIMVPVTVLGAAALALAIEWPGGVRGRRVGRVAAVVLLLVLLPAAAAATHPSPYIYQPSQHVSAAQAQGYAASFEHRQDGVAFAGIRGGPRRFVDLHYGTERARNTLEFPGYESGVPERVFMRANYTDYFEEPRYFEASPPAYEREVVLYEGFRYGSEGFRALETTPGVNRVRSNGGFTLYRIDPGGEGGE
jgi:hypothetical protein